ncbi:MAG: histidinol dehydrogenase [Spirochaetaceae bacterium]|nr:histidinol dehydrogenase [Spirochaetaceae bacterium]
MDTIKVIDAKNIPQSFFEPRIFSDDTTGNNASAIVADILNQVHTEGDKALQQLSAKFDKVSLSKIEILQEDLQNAARELKKENPALYDSLCYSRDLALDFARKQKECFVDFEVELKPGLFTGQRTLPVERAGLYVPAGRFPLLSSVIMTSAPALASGCNQVILCTPPRLHPADIQFAYADKGIMAAAAICGVHRVFACGGAQAVAAMAYGTESIPRCDVIAGPGNKFVIEAKRQVYGTVGIDMLAGPSEVFIIADSSANPEWVALDMLAQAEHDVDAQAILATTDKEFAAKVVCQLEALLKTLPTAEVAKTSLCRNGYIIIVDTLEQAAEIANRKAPEHLELALDKEPVLEKLSNRLRNYGSLFLGHGAAEVFGDYAAGLNHTLPTSTSARFTGGLSVRCFLKTVTTLRTEKGEGQINSATAAAIMGEAEGLFAHAEAARLRLK